MSTNTEMFLSLLANCRADVAPPGLRAWSGQRGPVSVPGTGQWGGIQEKGWHHLAERMPVGGDWTSTLYSAHVTYFWDGQKYHRLLGVVQQSQWGRNGGHHSSAAPVH